MTPFPTLEPEQMQAFIANMLATNGGCELPCWWGITPGKTKWETVVQSFTEQDMRVWEDGRLGLQYYSGQYQRRPMYVDMMEVNFYHEEGVVQSIDVCNDYYYTPLQDNFTTLWQRYTVQSVLSRYGVPSQVYLNLTTGAPCAGTGNFPNYGMWVVYADQGFAIRYPGLLLYDHEKWLVCPVFGQLKGIQIRLQSSDVVTELVDLTAEVYDPSGELFSIYGSLPDLTEMNMQMFYDAFSQSEPQTCITVQASHSENEIIMPSNSPVLSPDEEDALLVNELENNGGCELPCWWGITPGETHWEDAQQLFLSYGKSISSWETERWGTGHEVSLFGRHEPYPFDYVVEHLLYEQDGIVSLIGIHGHTPGWPADEWPAPQHFPLDWQHYFPDEVFARFGKPSQILLHYWVEGESPYSIGMLYENQGILIEYMGLTQGEKAEGEYYFDPVIICPGRNYFTDINIWLQSPESGTDTTLTDVFGRFGGGYLQMLGFGSTPTLEEATGMSIDEFYKTFQDPNANICLKAPADMGDRYP